MCLAFLALLLASDLVTAAPAPVDETITARDAAPAPFTHGSTSNAKRDDWSNGYYNTRVDRALDCYSSPSLNNDVVSYYKAGSSVAISCQTHGAQVDCNDVWAYTIRECYVPNAWLRIDQLWVDGLAVCPNSNVKRSDDVKVPKRALEEGGVVKTKRYANWQHEWQDGNFHTYVKQASDCYSAPSFNSEVAGYYKPGSTVVAKCQAIGDDVNGNDVWTHTIRGCYLPNDMLTIEKPWIGGVDECSAE